MHERLYPSFFGEEDSTATFTLHKESINESVTKGNTTKGDTNHNYYIEFADGRSSINEETYEYLFENTELTDWNWSSKTEEKL